MDVQTGFVSKGRCMLWFGWWGRGRCSNSAAFETRVGMRQGWMPREQRCSRRCMWSGPLKAIRRQTDISSPLSY
eukprot:13332475-Alexandrium_andersonii.AAC.1